ncbi:MAG: cation-translocating P-type ATPase [Acidimicrobiia bacterium]|nr:cation-translocating P-type ATPase [Acidimicrobiia bacterium]
METTIEGLSSDDVARRISDGRTNDVPNPTSRTISQIIKANVFTPFNLLLGILLAIILAIGEYRDALFGFVLVGNALIGIVQEVRSKRSLDALAVLNAPQSTVRRDGVDLSVASKDVVLDEIIVLMLGDQIVVDGEVLESTNLEIDESLLTGEAEPVDKATNENVMSGSFVVAGSGIMRATAVGADSYAFRLSSEARRFSLVKSELRIGINRVITIVGWMMIPVALILISSQLATHDGFVPAVQGSVAGLVAMVPEGLVLLTSIAFAVGATRLASKKVLTQELAAIEGLARVDTICLDKTGTLTEGSLSLSTVEHLGSQAASTVDPGLVLAAIGASDNHPNPSLAAVVAKYPEGPGWTLSDSIAFSSARKWSAAQFAEHGSWYLGAPDILLDHAASNATLDSARTRMEHYASQGQRVLLLAASPTGLNGEILPNGLEPIALVVLDEQLREAAPQTISYFGEQGIAVKVISGDSPVTVGAVATRCGVPGADEPIDARTLPEDQEALADVLEKHSVFGRVTPQQKRAMVHALQSRGHIVAMTGDGVNDTLALKDADVGIAMGSGSAAARAVARFVLLANDFSVFPSVVNEGRRVIANVERVANLFLTKTFYAVVLAIVVGLGRFPFPFLPRHFTIISALTIGIPGFVLALSQNNRRAISGFLRRVLRFAIPAGVIAAMATLVAYLIERNADVPLDQARTVAVITLFTIAIWVLAILCRPMSWWKYLLVVAMALGFIGTLVIPGLRNYFDLPLPDPRDIATAIGIGVIAAAIIEVGWRMTDWSIPQPATTD